MENNVAYQISSSVNDGIIEVVITGSSIGDTFEKMMYEVDAILEANDAKEVIFDIRSFEEHIDSTTFYHYAKKHNFFIYGVKTAVVDLQAKTSFAIALKNAGVPVERFADIDLARKWIKSNPIKETWV
jgi:hypothetical protein